jgi:hypothetical protein
MKKTSEEEAMRRIAKAVEHLVNEGIECSLIKPKNIRFKIEGMLFGFFKGYKKIYCPTEMDIVDIVNDERINIDVVWEFNKKIEKSGSFYLLYSEKTGNFYYFYGSYGDNGCEIFVRKLNKKELRDWILSEIKQ